MKTLTLEETPKSKALTPLRALIVGYSHGDLDSILLELRESGFDVEHAVAESREDFRAAVAERPEGERMWTGLKRGDAIVAVKLDRVFRSALDALQSVEDLRNMGVSLFLLDLGGDVTGNGISKLFLTIMSAVAEAERDRIRERITTVKRDQRAQHRFLGGLVPFGFVKQVDGTLAADPAMQVHIATAKRLRGEGKSL